MSRPLFRVSAESSAIERYLDSLEVGTTATYEALAKQAGLSTKDKKLGQAIRSATRRLRRQKAKAFGTITRVGVKLLSDTEILDLAEHRIARTGRMSRVTQEYVALVDYDRAPHPLQRRALELSTQNGLMSLWTQRGVLGEIQKAIGDKKPADVPAPRAFLALFSAQKQ